jgi:hypothetical protein
VTFYLGLDLGQSADPTVAVILEAHGERGARVYDIRHIEPYPLATPYPTIIESIRRLLARDPLAQECTLVIDQTGVGRAIFDMFVEAALQPIGVTITPGKNWHKDTWNQYHVAKELLVGTVQKFLQSERLRSSWRVRHSRLLKKELQAFRVRITKGLNEVYGPDVRESAHDDMVLACACALWVAEMDTPAASLSSIEMEEIWAAEDAEAGAWEPPRREIRRMWGNRSGHW